jgi:hypothetical protein
MSKKFTNNKMDYYKQNFNKNFLYNKYVLYFIFFFSFGNFFIEMMKGDMFFVCMYILIGFLTSFFNKNMIIILSISVIFANILKYGRASTMEGLENNSSPSSNVDDASHNQVTDQDTPISKKEGLKEMTDQEMLDMNYMKAEKLMSKQEDILQKLNEYKPFLDTMQGIAKNTGLSKSP